MRLSFKNIKSASTESTKYFNVNLFRFKPSTFQVIAVNFDHTGAEAFGCEEAVECADEAPVVSASTKLVDLSEQNSLNSFELMENQAPVHQQKL